MTKFQSMVLLGNQDLPTEKALAMLLFFGSVAIFATYASFLPAERLQNLSSVIGTNQPLGARIICIACSILGWIVIAAVVASMLGFLSS